MIIMKKVHLNDYIYTYMNLVILADIIIIMLHLLLSVVITKQDDTSHTSQGKISSPSEMSECHVSTTFKEKCE